MSWTAEAFGSWYLVVYPHRDEAEAHRLVATLERAVSLGGKRILDVGCGPGRHLAAFGTAGACAVGLDVSSALLAEARRVRAEAAGGWPLIRADMRSLPVADGAFDGVTSLFTSFGYFEEESDDRRSLREAARAVAPGGFHLLDFLNRDLVIQHPNPETERRSGEWAIAEKRRIEGGRRVVKRVTVRPASGGAPQADYEERVTLYGPEELCRMLEECGLSPQEEWGEYDGSPFDPDRSSRHLFLSRRAQRWG